MSVDNNTTSTRGFLWISDIHFDPYYATDQAAFASTCTPEARRGTGDRNKNDADHDTLLTFPPYGTVGCDAPYKLLHEVLGEASRVFYNHHVDAGDATSGNEEDDYYNHPMDFILITGDLCRHYNDDFDDPVQETKNVLTNVTNMLLSNFPNIPSGIIPSVGNNDFTPDYFLDLEVVDNSTTTTTTIAQNKLLQMLSIAFDNLFQSQSEKDTFLQGGYLSRNITDTPITILSLNTIMYSRSHHPDQTYIQDPLGQFEWLQKELEIAFLYNRKVYIVAHIPPTVGSYSKRAAWHEEYNDRYYSIIENYRDIIVGQFYGHFHSEEYRIVPTTKSGDAKMMKKKKNEDNSTSPQQYYWPLMMTSSITPVFGANPSFRIMQYESNTGAILNYNTHYFDLESVANSGGGGGSATTNTTTTTTKPKWVKLPSFSEAFQVPDVSTSSFQSTTQNLIMNINETDSNVWDTYLSRQRVSTSPGERDCDWECRVQWVCIIQAISTMDYTQCLLQYGISTPSSSSSSSVQESKDYMISAVIALGVVIVTTVSFFLFRRYRSSRRLLFYTMPPPHQLQEDNNDTDYGSSSQDASFVQSAVTTTTSDGSYYLNNSLVEDQLSTPSSMVITPPEIT